MKHTKEKQTFPRHSRATVLLPGLADMALHKVLGVSRVTR